MAQNYIVSYEARKLAAKSWGELRGKESAFGKQKATALFAGLRPLDENFYHFNICKLLYILNDSELSAYGDIAFGPTQYNVALGYMRGRGVNLSLDLARRHFEFGARLGSIPCYLCLYGMLPVWKKAVEFPVMLYCFIQFVYLKSRSEIYTRVLL